MIGYGKVARRIEDATRWPVPGPVVAVAGAQSMSSACNAILRAYATQDVEAVVIMHDDLEITDPDFESKVLKELADPTVGIVGVAGGSEPRMAWWDSKTRIGHQWTDSGLIDFGRRSGDVAVLEGSLLAFSPKAVDALRYDEQYTGWLGYDDVCLSSGQNGFRCVVVDIDTHHHSTAGFFKDPDGWAAAAVRWAVKWGAP